MKINNFEDLKIWKFSLCLTKEVYDYTARPNFSRDFCLRDQIRRSIISVSSNIVEGFEKNNNNEFVRFLRIAKGSVGETNNQLHIALVVGYINQSEFDQTNQKLKTLSRQIGALIYYLEKQKKSFIKRA